MLLALPVLRRRGLLSALRRGRVKALRRRAILRRSLSLLVLSLRILRLQIVALLVFTGWLLAVLLLLLRLAVLAAGALASVGHGHDVGTLLEGFVKVADAADNVLVSLDGERNQGLFSLLVYMASLHWSSREGG